MLADASLNDVFSLLYVDFLATDARGKKRARPTATTRRAHLRIRRPPLLGSSVFFAEGLSMVVAFKRFVDLWP